MRGVDLKSMRELAVVLADLDVAVPGVREGARVGVERQRRDRRPPAWPCSVLSALSASASVCCFIGLKRGRPSRSRGQPEVVVQQLVHETADDLAVFAVDLDGEADVLLRDQHDHSEESEDRAAVPDDAGAAVVADVPAQRVGVEHRLRQLQGSG